MNKSRIQPGERVVVGTWSEMTTVVEFVVPDPHTGDVAVCLDWGDHGKSRVWEHDEGKTWKRYSDWERDEADRRRNSN